MSKSVKKTKVEVNAVHPIKSKMQKAFLIKELGNGMSRVEFSDETYDIPSTNVQK